MVDRLIDRAARALELALAVAFLFAVLLNFTNVVGRYIFGTSILWADEIQIFIMIAVTFLGAAIVTWRNAHLRMDALARLFSPNIRTALRAIELLTMLVLCGFVFFNSQDFTWRTYDLGRLSDAAHTPMWIPHGSLTLGFGLIFLVCLWQAYREIRPTPASGQTSEGMGL